eukprot:1160373-Pelagomonas_calceolata.AAC.10
MPWNNALCWECAHCERNALCRECTHGERNALSYVLMVTEKPCWENHGMCNSVLRCRACSGEGADQPGAAHLEECAVD